MPDLLFSVPTLSAQGQSPGETGKEATEGGDFQLPLSCLLASISTSTSPREAATELLDEQSAAML